MKKFIQNMLGFLQAITIVICLSLGCLYVPQQVAQRLNPGPDIQITTQITPASTTEVYFPRKGQDPAPVIASLYNGATSTLDIAIYSLTHPVMVKAIGDAAKRGIKVRVITDKIQSAGNTQKHAMNDLITIGIPIKIETHSGLMHLKMSIIDAKIASTGSYNYSKGASEDNDEMFILIKEQWFADTCQIEFNRLWASPQFVDLRMSY